MEKNCLSFSLNILKPTQNSSLLPVAPVDARTFKENPESTENLRVNSFCLKFPNILSGVGMLHQNLSSKALL